MVTALLLSYVALQSRWPGAAEWPAPDGPHRDLLCTLMLDHAAAESFDSAILALGSDAAPEIEAYLDHPDPVVSSRAFRALTLFPDMKRDILLKYRHAESGIVRRYALQAMAIQLDHDPQMERLFIETIAIPPGERQPHLQVAHDMLLGKPPHVRRRLAQQIVPRMAALLEDAGSMQRYSWEWMQRWVRTLARIAPAGDEGLLRAVRAARDDAERRLLEAAERDSPPGDRSVRQVREAFLVALTDLGDPDAVARFQLEALSGEADGRFARLSYLGFMHPTPAMLELAIRLLDDEAAIQHIAPSHSTQRTMKRACDFAAEALDRWQGRLNRTPRYTLYLEEELASARRELSMLLAAAGELDPIPASKDGR